jgi:hypothetical protein
MRLGLKSISDIFQRSSVSLALALGGVAAVAMTVQFSMHLPENFSGLIVTVVNLLMIFLTFTLLLEFCRLRHQRRALGFVALWLFVLVVVPLILGAVFASEEAAQVCLLAPGFLALTSVVVFLFIDWRRQWKKLLARAA